MAEEPFIEKHHKWGRNIAHYPQLFTKEALAALLEAPDDDIKQGIEREIALHAIQRICALGDPKINEYSRDSLINFITLDELECTPETARFAGELVSFALPRLVAGCIVLMSSVEPSPFHYEYGYMCFKIMVAALNTCLLKHTARLDLPFNITSPNNCLSVLWEAYPTAFLADIAFSTTKEPHPRGLTPLQPWISTLLEKPRFDTLLALLDIGKKNFTIALKNTGSLGLFGLMQVLRQYIEAEETTMEKGDYEEKLLLPFTHVFYRYRLVVPNIGVEPDFIGSIHSPDPAVANQAGKFIDLEDSRNRLQAYINCLNSRGRVTLFECSELTMFLAPLIVPGCEDLICGVFDASMKNLWDSLSDTGLEPSRLFIVFHTILVYLKRTLGRLQPSSTEDHSWILRVMDRMIYNDVAGLILRAMLMQPPSVDESDPQGEITHKIIPEVLGCYIDLLLTYTPDEYRKILLRDSGTLCDWQKYLHHFAAYNILEPTNVNCRWNHFCSVLLIEFWKTFMGDEWESELSAVGAGRNGICSNPRCPFPFGAKFVSSKHTGGPFCNARCHAFGSMYAPQFYSTGIVVQGKALRSLVSPLEFMPDVDLYTFLCGDIKS